MLQNLPDNFKIVEIFDKSGHTEWTTLSAAVGRDRKVSISIENYSIESVNVPLDTRLSYITSLWAVVEEQLIEQSLVIPEYQGLYLVIGNFYWTFLTLKLLAEKTKYV